MSDGKGVTPPGLEAPQQAIVELRDIVVGDAPGWLVTLKVGNQQFTIGSACDVKEDADFMADMLRKALSRCVPSETPRTAIQPEVRLALMTLLNHVEPGWDNCRAVVQNWLEAK